MTFLVVTNVIASRPPEQRPTGTPTARAKMFNHRNLAVKRYKIQNGRNGDTKRLTEFEKWFNSRFLIFPVKICKISFVIRATIISEKVVTETKRNTSPSAPGALVHRLQHPELPLGGSKNADGVWKGAYT